MDKKSLKDRLAEFIQDTQTEIDEMRMQLALGKMEAADVFEKLKKDLKEEMNSFTVTETTADGLSSPAGNKMKEAFECLRTELEKGKALARDGFAQQREKIHNCIDLLEQQIRANNYRLPPDLNLKLRNELYKFKLKTDILKIKYEIGKLELKEKADKTQEEVKKEFDTMISKFPQMKEDIGETINEAGEGLRKTYGKLKKSFD